MRRCRGACVQGGLIYPVMTEARRAPREGRLEPPTPGGFAGPPASCERGALPIPGCGACLTPPRADLCRPRLDLWADFCPLQVDFCPLRAAVPLGRRGEGGKIFLPLRCLRAPAQIHRAALRGSAGRPRSLRSAATACGATPLAVACAACPAQGNRALPSVSPAPCPAGSGVCAVCENACVVSRNRSYVQLLAA